MTPQILFTKTNARQFVPTYFRDLDKVIEGLHKSNLILIGGRPAMGCRSLVLTMACKQAWDNRSVACFFMTLSEIELEDRAARIFDYYKMPKTPLTPQPLFFIDYKLDIDKLHNEIERLKRERHIEAVYVESVQMIGVKDNAATTYEYHTELAVKSLWEMSREFDIPIIALSSLSRDTVRRVGDKAPMISDLRESGTLEVYADVVLLLNRPEYYGLKCDEFGNATIGRADINVAKNAFGQMDDVRLVFDQSQSVFYDSPTLLELKSKINS